MNVRPSVDLYALALAHIVKLRSEDPYLQVGAVAVNKEGRIIATGYNGLKTGVTLDKNVWDNREQRRPYIIHAEINLCALIRRGEAQTVAVTTSPCEHCANALIACGFTRVIYTHDFRDQTGIDLLKFYKIETIKYDFEQVSNLIRSGL